MFWIDRNKLMNKPKQVAFIFHYHLCCIGFFLVSDKGFQEITEDRLMSWSIILFSFKCRCLRVSRCGSCKMGREVLWRQWLKDSRTDFDLLEIDILMDDTFVGRDGRVEWFATLSEFESFPGSFDLFSFVTFWKETSYF